MDTKNKEHAALIDAMMDIVESNIRASLKQPPVYTLREILPHRTVEDLKFLSKATGLTCYSKMKKAELVEALCGSLTHPEILKTALMTLDREEWEFFKKAAGQKQLENSLVTLDSFLNPQDLGLLQSFCDGENIIVVVPEEIRNTFAALAQKGEVDAIERAILINTYGIAAVSLYGIISLEELLDIFNSQNDIPATVEELFATLLQYNSTDCEYCFYHEYVVHASFESDDFRDVAHLKDDIKDKPRYIPPKEEFLMYAEPEYFEQTPAIEKLVDFILAGLTEDRLLAYEIVEDIAMACANEESLDEIFKTFEDHEIVFQSQKQFEQMVKLITDVGNNTRLWRNKGYPPCEATLAFKKPPAGSAAGPGRNDPCPCGSGKKYKKCCGSIQ